MLLLGLLEAPPLDEEAEDDDDDAGDDEWAPPIQLHWFNDSLNESRGI